MSAAAATIAAFLATAAATPVGEVADAGQLRVMRIDDSSAMAAWSDDENSRGAGATTAVDSATQSMERSDAAVAVEPEGGSGSAPEEKREPARRKEILVEGEVGKTPGDPLEDVNLQTFEVVQALDMALVEPLAHGYIAIVPKPVRDGIHNAVINLDEPIVFLSFLLQVKPVQALKTLGRFLVNSTLGLGGLFDVARNKPFNRPHIKNGIGHTLAYYGVGTGPFLYLPLVGSTNLRDFLAGMAQIPILPTTIGKPFNDPLYVIPKVTLSALDERAQEDERIQQYRGKTSNPYASFRSYYLRKRQAEVDFLRGLRKDAEVPMFDDVPVDAPEEGAQPAGEAGGSETGGPQMHVEEAVPLTE